MSKKAVATLSPASPGARSAAAAAAAAAPEPPACAAADAEAPEAGQFVISAAALAEVEAGATAHERAQRLHSALGVRHYRSNARSRAWADLLFGVLRFGVDDARLGRSKTLRLLSIASELFEAAGAPSAADGSPPPLEAVYELFSARMREASARGGEGPAASSGSEEDLRQPGPAAAAAASPFSVHEVAQVVDFMASTLFRHLAAYQQVASGRRPRSSVTAVLPLVVETPLAPPPLATHSTVDNNRHVGAKELQLAQFTT